MKRLLLLLPLLALPSCDSPGKAAAAEPTIQAPPAPPAVPDAAESADNNVTFPVDI